MGLGRRWIGACCALIGAAIAAPAYGGYGCPFGYGYGCGDYAYDGYAPAVYSYGYAPVISYGYEEPYVGYGYRHYGYRHYGYRAGYGGYGHRISYSGYTHRIGYAGYGHRIGHGGYRVATGACTGRMRTADMEATDFGRSDLRRQGRSDPL